MKHKSATALLFAVLSCAASATFADELADAGQMLAQKNYPDALRLYGKLAAAGNAEAQLRLGEMHWYGEGTALDRARGDALFAQAAAQGNKEAIAATALSGKRSANMAEIANWSTQYTGADLVPCTLPVVPAISKTNAEIVAVSKAIDNYGACHNGFLARVVAAMPSGKAIPDGIVVLMSEQELALARTTISAVVERLLAAASANTAQLQGQHLAWKQATESYVAKANTDAVALQLAMQQSERSGRRRPADVGAANTALAARKAVLQR
jgi:uncharacterized protein